MVTVEFFGIPRQRAGRAELTVQAATLADLLAQVEKNCPQLQGLLRPDGTLAPHFLLSLQGERFTTDLQETVPPGSTVFLLSADVGG